MTKWLYDLFNKGCAVIVALVALQLPLFMQQYSDQLVGHIAELKHQLVAVEKAASLNGKTLPQYIHKFLQSSDPDFSAQGRLMEAMVNRIQLLSDSLVALGHTSLFYKPFYFFTHCDWEIVKSTYDHFTLGIPLTIEGIIYALSGLAISSVVMAGLAYLGRGFIQRLWNKRQLT